MCESMDLRKLGKIKSCSYLQTYIGQSLDWRGMINADWSPEKLTEINSIISLNGEIRLDTNRRSYVILSLVHRL